MANAASIAKRATSRKLSDPDWALNIELCDILNTEPRQRRDALKMIKKKLLNRNQKKQLLALFVLETLSKNCGEYIFLDMVEQNILNEMVKIAEKKPDINVREKILALIDIWQAALGGPLGSFHLYYDAYMELKSFGLEFPPREENSVPLVTPPKADPLMVSRSEELVIRASSESDSSELSVAELENAAGIAGILLEMLSALDPNHPQSLKDEIIIELVDQCRSHQKHVADLVNNTIDERLLLKGLELNDILQQVLAKHDDIANGKASVPEIGAPSPANMDQQDEFTESHDCDKMINRSSQEPALQNESSTTDSGSTDDLSDIISFDSPPISTESCAVSEEESMCKQRVQHFDQVCGEEGCSVSEFGKGSKSILKSNKAPAIDEEEEMEEALLKELVEYAKARAASIKPKRSFQVNT